MYGESSVLLPVSVPPILVVPSPNICNARLPVYEIVKVVELGAIFLSKSANVAVKIPLVVMLPSVASSVMLAFEFPPVK